MQVLRYPRRRPTSDVQVRTVSLKFCLVGVDGDSLEPLMRLAVLCNHWMALTALESLAREHLLAGVATPRVEDDASRRVRTLAGQCGLAHAAIGRDGRSSSLTAWLDTARPDAVFVIAFPYRIPEKVLRIPKLGFFNFHLGALPRYRGPDPVFWQIRNQEPFGALTVHQMDGQLDGGPIAEIRRLEILPEETYGLHLNKLAMLLGNAAVELARRLVAGPDALPLEDQDDASAVYQSRPSSEDLAIDWSGEPSASIDALIRAANPAYGGAVTFIRGVPIRVLQAGVASHASLALGAATTRCAPGTIVSVGSRAALLVQCRDQALLRLEVVASEDGVMTGDRFAELYGVESGDQFVLLPTAA